MSKIKNPRAKKAASLTRDHRSDAGDKSRTARKAIPREKARTKRTHRRAVHEALHRAEPLASEAELERAEGRLVEAGRVARSKGFRKPPDVPLGEYLEAKGRRRGR